jgi:catechol 2,3-dioxygenase-like lactoylglutathione lyase family enzyme
MLRAVTLICCLAAPAAARSAAAQAAPDPADRAPLTTLVLAVQDAPSRQGARLHAAVRDPDGNTLELYGP